MLFRSACTTTSSTPRTPTTLAMINSTLTTCGAVEPCTARWRYSWTTPTTNRTSTARRLRWRIHEGVRDEVFFATRSHRRNDAFDDLQTVPGEGAQMAIASCDQAHAAHAEVA